MNILIKKTLLASMLALACTTQVSATTVTLNADGLWNLFDVDNTWSQSGGLEWIDAQSASGYNNDGSALDFSFNLTEPAYLTVVDGGVSGDQYRVFDKGIELGFTSVVSTKSAIFTGTNFDAALLDSNFSSQVFYLTAGTHDITGLLSASAVDGSNTAFNVSVGAVNLVSASNFAAAVPLPAGFTLFLTGLGLLAASARRRAFSLLG